MPAAAPRSGTHPAGSQLNRLRWSPIWAATIAVVVVTIVAHRQLLVPVGFGSRDHIDWYIRVVEYAREWESGHWPQTLPDAFLGAGHAFPKFYPPLSYWMAVPFYEVLGDPIAATHLSGLTALIVAGALTVLLAHRLTGSVTIAFGAGVACTLFPYSLQQLQARGALAEVWASAWYPLVALGALKSADTDRIHPVFVMALALVLLSHMVMALWVLPLLCLSVALSRPRPAVALRQTVLAGAMAAGLAAFHLLPVLAGIPSTRAGDPAVVLATAWDVTNAGGLLTRSSWSPVLFLGLALVTIRLGAIAWFRPGGTVPSLARLATIAVMALASVMTAPEVVWSVVPPQWRYIQFPVRLLSPIVFLAILGALDRLRDTKPGRAWAGWILAAALVVAWFEGRHAIMPRSLHTVDIERLMTGEYSLEGFTVAQEYLPRGTHPDVLVDSIRRIRAEVGAGPILAWDPSGRDPAATIEISTPTLVTLPLVAYGFLVPRLAGGAPLEVEDNGGLLAVRLAAGRHDIVVRRSFPAALWVGFGLSGATLLGMAVWIRRRRPAA